MVIILDPHATYMASSGFNGERRRPYKKKKKKEGSEEK
jgi:hypothetical protein